MAQHNDEGPGGRAACPHGRRDRLMKVESAMVTPRGESGCGKNTLCVRGVALTRARGPTMAGVLTPPRFASCRKVGPGRNRPAPCYTLRPIGDGRAGAAAVGHRPGVADWPRRHAPTSM